MTTETLSRLTVANLRELAKKYQIKNRWEMKKEELISNLKPYFCEDNYSKQKEERKRKYLDKGTLVGQLIAFEEPDTGKMNTAKVISANKNTVLCKTNYNMQFAIKRENILWVRTGSKWPKYIYKRLKDKT